MKTTTLWPLFCSPTAASTTNLSAPPIPRSGWKKTIVFFFPVAVVSAILPGSWLNFAFLSNVSKTLERTCTSNALADRRACDARPDMCQGGPWLTKPLIRSQPFFIHLGDICETAYLPVTSDSIVIKISPQQQHARTKASFSIKIGIKESEKNLKLQKPPWSKALREGYLKYHSWKPRRQTSLLPARVRRFCCPPHYVLAMCHQTIPIVHPSCRMAEGTSIFRHHVLFFPPANSNVSFKSFQSNPPPSTALIPLPLYAIYRTLCGR